MKPRFVNMRSSIRGFQITSIALIGREKWLAGCLRVLLCFTPLTFLVDGLIQISIGGMSFCNLAVSATVVFCVVVGWTLVQGKGSGAFLGAIGILVLVLFIKAFFQGSWNNFVPWLYQYQYYFMVPLLAYAVIQSKLNAEEIAKTVRLISVPVAVISLYFFFTKNYFGLVSQEVLNQYAIVGTRYTRMLGVFGSPNVAGSYFAIVLAFDFLFGAKGGRLRILYRSVTFACLILSFSRMAFLGFALFLVIGILSGDDAVFPRGRKLISPHMGALLIGMGFLAIVLAMAGSGIYFWHTGTDFFENPRLEKWVSFLKTFGDYALVGHPFALHIISEGATLSDNSFLMMLGSFGILGSIPYFYLLIKGFAPSLGTSGSRIGVLLMLLLFLFLSDFMALYPSSYLMVFLLIALGRRRESTSA